MANLATLHMSQQQEQTTDEPNPAIPPDLATELHMELDLECDCSRSFERQFCNAWCQVTHAQDSKAHAVECLHMAEADAALQLGAAAEANTELTEKLALMTISAQNSSGELSDAHNNLDIAQHRIDDYAQ